MIPLLVNLKEKKIVVVGGGEVATRKVKRLVLETTVTVISPEISDELASLHFQKKIQYIARKYQSGDIEGADLIYICTNEEKINQQILKEKKASQWINDTTQQGNSDFFSMAEIKEEEMVLALSSKGKNPKKTRKKIAQLKKWLKRREE